MQSWLHNMEWAVAMRTDLLTIVFKAFSVLGYSGFLLLFVPIGYWIFSKRIFAHVGLWLLLSVLLNFYLKEMFQDPRPDLIFQLDTDVGESYGFPSGHAQAAIVIWFWIAWEARKPWIWVLSSILVVGICFSRLYLGVHDVGDVLGGTGIGLISLLIFIFLTTKRFKWWHNLNPFWQVLAIMIIEVFLFLIWPGKLSGRTIGMGVFLIGFWLGVAIEREQVCFQKHTDWGRVLASAVVGVILLIAMRKGFQVAEGIFESGRMVVALSGALINGIYMTALAPWIFQFLKLADKGNITHD
jgi:membrane-associated phospholipid phosphatase